MATGDSPDGLQPARWCLTCQCDAFRPLLAPPIDEDEPGSCCELSIPTICEVCWPSTYVSACGMSRRTDNFHAHKCARVRIHLPTRAVNSVTTILNLARHQLDRAEKLAQYQAQIEHLFKAYTKDSEFAFSLRCLAERVCIQEQQQSNAVVARRWTPWAWCRGRSGCLQDIDVPTGRFVGCRPWICRDWRVEQRVYMAWRHSNSVPPAVPGTVTSVHATGPFWAGPHLVWDPHPGERTRATENPNLFAASNHPRPNLSIEDGTASTTGSTATSFATAVSSEVVVLSAPVVQTPSVASSDPPTPPPTPPPPVITVSRVDLDDERATADTHDHEADRHAMDEMHCDSACIESITLVPPEDKRLETPGDGGECTAERRAPHLGPKPMLFSNNANNLTMAECTRNNGDAGPVRDEQMNPLILDAAKAFCDVVLDKKKCNNLRVLPMDKELPKKYVCKERQRIEDQMWTLHCESLPPSISASIKKEVTSKKKPRPIQAHGIERLALNCPLLGTFERILKARLGRYTIKGRDKMDVMKGICSAAADMSWRGEKLYPLMFDQTAFEFGINETFKEAECIMLRCVASLLDSEYTIYPDDLVDYVINERTASIDWVMKCKDARGFKFTHVIEMIRTMRQSGDRGTSSLNWFANALWCCVSTCQPGSYHKFWENMLKGNHTGSFVVPAYDSLGQIELILNMEGDDVVGFANRDIAARFCEVAHASGWKAKNELAPASANGEGHVTYVGFHCYTVNGVPKRIDGQFIIIPELKRFLTTKAWSIAFLERDERAACNVLNYMVYSRAFKQLTPMSNLCRAVASGWRQIHQQTSGSKRPSKLKVTSTAVLRDIEYRVGVPIATDQIGALLAGAEFPDITEAISAKALELSSHVCGHQWGIVDMQAVMELMGIVELDPLSTTAEMKTYVPPCWYSSEVKETLM